MRILFLGDIVGKPGRRAVGRFLPRLIDVENLALVIGNCENVTDGAGVDPGSAQELMDAGIDVLTSGNHVWRRKEIIEFIQTEPRLVRPANFPPGAPGAGWTVVETAGGVPIAVLNLIGRVFMDSVDCPFRTAEALLPELTRRARAIVVDMHCEATSEKGAMGWFLAGRVAAVLGSHTHVQTADERVLPGGTAYVTDVGMVGPRDGCIGMDKKVVLQRFLTGVPNRFVVASGPVTFNSVLITISSSTGRATAIQRIDREHI